jgi:hypothetical protein
MLPKCPKCEGDEFVIEQLPIENSKSVLLVVKCSICGCEIGSKRDDNPSETDDIMAKYCKFIGIERDDFKVVSMKKGY